MVGQQNADIADTLQGDVAIATGLGFCYSKTVFTGTVKRLVKTGQNRQKLEYSYTVYFSLVSVKCGIPILHYYAFWTTVCKTVCPMLSDHCPVSSLCPVCDVGVFWPNGWMDQDET